VSIFGDGTQSRAFSHVSDVAPIIAGVIERPEAYDQIFNIGADHPVTINELGEAVCGAMGVPFRPRYMPERFEVKHMYPSHAKARDVLGYQGRVDLEDGLRAMAKWVKEIGARTSKRFEGIEIERNLPAAWRD
jgi:UDP-glucose 4-epimerase